MKILAGIPQENCVKKKSQMKAAHWKRTRKSIAFCKIWICDTKKMLFCLAGNIDAALKTEAICGKTGGYRGSGTLDQIFFFNLCSSSSSSCYGAKNLRYIFVMLCAHFEYGIHFSLSPWALILRISLIFCKDLQMISFSDFTLHGINGFCMIQGLL